VIEDIFRFCDELGPTKILHVYEPKHELKAILVVDNVAAGPSVGGIRMAPDVSTEECFRLARAMTLKNAAAGLAHGGGKAVVYGDPKMPRGKKEMVIRGLANALRDIEEYILAPDMGTDEECMAWIRDEIGRVVGLPRVLGGIPLDEIGATGWGIRHAAEVALTACDFGLEGARVVVQGFGAVGKHAARFLTEQGAILVGASDSKGAIYHSQGLDIQNLIELKTAGKSVADYPDGQKGDRDAAIDMECDIWIPAARPDVIRKDNVGRLKARLVLEGANIPITQKAERMLHARGVLCIPDFIANAGGVICAAMEYRGATEAAALEAIEEKLRLNTRQVLDRVTEKRIPPRDAAMEIALQRVQRAINFRRWAIF
jgi:glutamate dehydrogenase (NAD(P)+)